MQRAWQSTKAHCHPLQPKMLSSCDALSYHWNLASMAERVGLPLCNGSANLNTLLHRFSVQPMYLHRSDVAEILPLLDRPRGQDRRSPNSKATTVWRAIVGSQETGPSLKTFQGHNESRRNGVAFHQLNWLLLLLTDSDGTHLHNLRHLH